jgi:hypothetical protein
LLTPGKVNSITGMAPLSSLKVTTEKENTIFMALSTLKRNGMNLKVTVKDYLGLKTQHIRRGANMYNIWLVQ